MRPARPRGGRAGSSHSHTTLLSNKPHRNSHPCAAVPSPPPAFDLRATTLPTTRTLIQSRWPQLADLVDTGILVAAPRSPSYVERRSDGYQEPELVLLVATAHVSTASAAAVTRVIEAVQPDAVVVELCKSRSGVLQEQEDQDGDDTSTSTTPNPYSVAGSLTRSMRLAGGNPAALLLRLLLARAASSVAASVDGAVAPGADARAAASAARRVGATVVLGDRPIEITLARAWGLSWRQKVDVLRTLSTLDTRPALTTVADVEALAADPSSLASIAAALAQAAPPLHAALLTERDEWLAWSLARSRAVNGARVVVGVLGAGHVRGVTWHLLQREDRPRFQALAGVRDGNARAVVTWVGRELAIGFVVAAAAAAWLM